MFFNTGISTYLWIVTNHKSQERKGKLQLIDGSSFYAKMRKGLGSKRRELTEDHIREITQIFGSFKEVRRPNPNGGGAEIPISLIFSNQSFGYRTITVERPLRDDRGKVVLGTKGR
jgi:type I restriction enzyme M protein